MKAIAHTFELAAALQFAELEVGGSTVIGVVRDGVLRGWLALGDALRSDACETVSRPHALGSRTALVTWSAPRVGRSLALR